MRKRKAHLTLFLLAYVAFACSKPENEDGRRNLNIPKDASVEKEGKEENSSPRISQLISGVLAELKDCGKKIEQAKGSCLGLQMKDGKLIKIDRPEFANAEEFEFLDGGRVRVQMKDKESAIFKIGDHYEIEGLVDESSGSVADIVQAKDSQSQIIETVTLENPEPTYVPISGNLRHDYDCPGVIPSPIDGCLHVTGRIDYIIDRENFEPDEEFQRIEGSREVRLFFEHEQSQTLTLGARYTFNVKLSNQNVISEILGDVQKWVPNPTLPKEVLVEGKLQFEPKYCSGEALTFPPGGCLVFRPENGSQLTVNRPNLPSSEEFTWSDQQKTKVQIKLAVGLSEDLTVGKSYKFQAVVVGTIIEEILGGIVEVR